MVGAPASGKSTLAAKLEADAHRYGDELPIILSSDAMRAVIGTGEEDQSVSAKVFETLRNTTAYLLSRGHSVIIDATNTTRKARAEFIAIGRKYKAEVRAAVVKVSIETAKARNMKRARVVPEHVIDRMFGQFEMPTEGEVDAVDIFEE